MSAPRHPATASRNTRQEWADIGAADFMEITHSRKVKLLAAPEPSHIPGQIDAEIWAQFARRLAELISRRPLTSVPRIASIRWVA